MIVCPRCHEPNQPGKEFCASCGEFLGWEVEAPALNLDGPEPDRTQPQPAASPAPEQPAAAGVPRPAGAAGAAGAAPAQDGQPATAGVPRAAGASGAAPAQDGQPASAGVPRAAGAAGAAAAPDGQPAPDAAHAIQEAEQAEQHARRVRAEAASRAMAVSEAAKRQAVDDTLRARQEAAAQVDDVVETARRTAGVSGADLAAMVAQVRQDAQVKADADAQMAELRAARKARRAREEAYARARAEAADADRRAQEAAARAAALVARPDAGTGGASGDPTAPLIAAGDPTTPLATATDPGAASAGYAATPRARTTGPGDASDRYAATPRTAEPDTAPIGLAVPAGSPPAGGPVAPVLPGRPAPTPRAATAADVGPVPPGGPARRPPPTPPPATGDVVNPGDVVCPRCHAGNGAGRHFCRRCGEMLTPEVSAPAAAAGRRGPFRRWGAGDAAATSAKGGSSSVQPRTLARAAAAAVVVIGGILALGPYHKEVGADIAGVRRHIVPRPAYIENEVATTGPARTRVPALTNKVYGQNGFSSTVQSGNPPPADAQPVFTVSVGKDGDLSCPVDLIKVGIIAGPVGETPPKHPAPHHVRLVALGPDGATRKAKIVDLRDNTGFQVSSFAAHGVSRVDVYVLDTYGAPPDRQGGYTFDQIELFTPT